MCRIDYESKGRRFKSFRAHHLKQGFGLPGQPRQADFYSNITANSVFGHPSSAKGGFFIANRSPNLFAVRPFNPGKTWEYVSNTTDMVESPNNSWTKK
jgi:hypothetical protein